MKATLIVLVVVLTTTFAYPAYPDDSDYPGYPDVGEQGVVLENLR